VAATLCLNFFFLPPTGTLTIDAPSNWVALACFLAASALVSRLVALARQEAAGALARQRELEVLYELSFGLFTQRPGALGEAAARTLGAIGTETGALILAGGEPVVIGGPLEIDGTLAEAARNGTGILEDGGTSYIPLQVGGRIGSDAGGVLVAREANAPLAVLEPAVRLLALAVERERLLREAAHLEAVRQSDNLKTALLRAVSHDLRTPLTALRLEVESLQGRFADRPEALASLRGLGLQQERLTRRIDNLLALARLEAGVARPHPEPTPAGSLFRAARESLALVLEGRPVEVRIPPRCPDLWADPSVTLEVLVNLLENAARAAPPDRPLELAAEPHDGRIRIEVRDRGPGMPVGERGGLGLQIASSLAEAGGGTLELLDRPGGGTIARLDLPSAPEPEEMEA
jgi:two-component system sensor histidine kinase KdpD